MSTESKPIEFGSVAQLLALLDDLVIVPGADQAAAGTAEVTAVENILTARNPSPGAGRPSRYQLKEVVVPGDDHCALYVLGTDRAAVKQALTDAVKEEAARKRLAPEILSAIELNQLAGLKNDKWDGLATEHQGAEAALTALQARLVDSDSALASKTVEEHIEALGADTDNGRTLQAADQRVKDGEAAKLAYCEAAEICKTYIDDGIGRNLWLGYQSILLYAEQKKITVYIWRKGDDNSLAHIDSHVEDHPKIVIHMLHTGGYTHFNLLCEPIVLDPELLAESAADSAASSASAAASSADDNGELLAKMETFAKAIASLLPILKLLARRAALETDVIKAKTGIVSNNIFYVLNGGTDITDTCTNGADLTSTVSSSESNSDVITTAYGQHEITDGEGIQRGMGAAVAACVLLSEYKPADKDPDEDDDTENPDPLTAEQVALLNRAINIATAVQLIAGNLVKLQAHFIQCHSKEVAERRQAVENLSIIVATTVTPIIDSIRSLRAHKDAERELQLVYAELLSVFRSNDPGESFELMNQVFTLATIVAAKKANPGNPSKAGGDEVLAFLIDFIFHFPNQITIKDLALLDLATQAVSDNGLGMGQNACSIAILTQAITYVLALKKVQAESRRGTPPSFQEMMKDKVSIAENADATVKARLAEENEAVQVMSARIGRCQQAVYSDLGAFLSESGLRKEQFQRGVDNLLMRSSLHGKGNKADLKLIDALYAQITDKFVGVMQPYMQRKDNNREADYEFLCVQQVAELKEIGDDDTTGEKTYATFKYLAILLLWLQALNMQKRGEGKFEKMREHVFARMLLAWWVETLGIDGFGEDPYEVKTVKSKDASAAGEYETRLVKSKYLKLALTKVTERLVELLNKHAEEYIEAHADDFAAARAFMVAMVKKAVERQFRLTPGALEKRKLAHIDKLKKGSVILSAFLCERDRKDYISVLEAAFRDAVKTSRSSGKQQKRRSGALERKVMELQAAIALREGNAFTIINPDYPALYETAVENIAALRPGVAGAIEEVATNHFRHLIVKTCDLIEFLMRNNYTRHKKTDAAYTQLKFDLISAIFTSTERLDKDSLCFQTSFYLAQLLRDNYAAYNSAGLAIPPELHRYAFMLNEYVIRHFSAHRDLGRAQSFDLIEEFKPDGSTLIDYRRIDRRDLPKELRAAYDAKTQEASIAMVEFDQKKDYAYYQAAFRALARHVNQIIFYSAYDETHVPTVRRGTHLTQLEVVNLARSFGLSVRVCLMGDNPSYYMETVAQHERALHLRRKADAEPAAAAAVADGSAASAAAGSAASAARAAVGPALSYEGNPLFKNIQAFLASQQADARVLVVGSSPEHLARAVLANGFKQTLVAVHAGAGVSEPVADTVAAGMKLFDAGAADRLQYDIEQQIGLLCSALQGSFAKQIYTLLSVLKMYGSDQGAFLAEVVGDAADAHLNVLTNLPFFLRVAAPDADMQVRLCSYYACDHDHFKGVVVEILVQKLQQLIAEKIASFIEKAVPRSARAKIIKQCAAFSVIDQWFLCRVLDQLKTGAIETQLSSFIDQQSGKDQGYYFRLIKVVSQLFEDKVLKNRLLNIYGVLFKQAAFKVTGGIPALQAELRKYLPGRVEISDAEFSAREAEGRVLTSPYASRVLTVGMHRESHSTDSAVDLPVVPTTLFTEQ